MSVVIANNKAYIKFQHTDVCSVISFMKLLYPHTEIYCLVNRGNYKSSLLIDEFIIKVYRRKIVVEINNVNHKNPVIRKAAYAYLNKMLKKYKKVESYSFKKKVDYRYDIQGDIIMSETPIHKYKDYFDSYYIH